MKRLVIACALLLFGCDDSSPKLPAEAGPVPGICKLSECPKPASGTACCTPDAACGHDSTGLGLTCTPNEAAECILKDCPTPLFGNTCCTPTAACGFDPFGNGLLCIPNGPAIHLPEAGLPPPACDLTSCPTTDGGPKACCQANGQCGVDTLGIGLCFPPPPPPTCDLSSCPTTEGGPKSCCQANGQCGLDSLGIGLCFPPPVPLCDVSKCPTADGGAKACCQLNGQCGVDTLGIGICFAPPPAPTCDLSSCPQEKNGPRACCLPTGGCGVDSLGIGLCFAPPPTLPDGGAIPPVTGPPNDPSVNGECPSFLGVFGPVWGCCSAYGVCGTFADNACLLPVGTQLPVGPPPPAEAGTTEPFLRCNPPAKKTPPRDD